MRYRLDERLHRAALHTLQPKKGETKDADIEHCHKCLLDGQAIAFFLSRKDEVHCLQHARSCFNVMFIASSMLVVVLTSYRLLRMLHI
ncbi:uncharacterized protein PHALS_14704 [Plasmopara halstedii]|uniref:Uncharacterized protein n=1 Tax=Plasmopara halstedii TaxID=4781 RepID=A0A0P1AQ16_PLAHL|nr:uncharacterized protein PHALS_14704 [Plasmopara halstedii]CEG43335.1 hypothetical protein PHALS_14704 [Plasmopara halstedii]|eukprot:XP_024579704.1 hypothetical protein PHALS_14704 [Plasmopara halstedii]